MSGTDPLTSILVDRLIGELDDAGYLRTDLGEIAERLGAGPERMEEALRLLQSFEPSGIGARDLSECLALQLRERDRLDPAMAALLTQLPLLAKRDFPALRAACGVDDEDLSDMIAELRGLDPRPGSAYAAGAIEPVIPDVLLRPAPDGSWLLELNPATLPRVLVNQSYCREVSRRSPEARAFLSGCLQSANWLVKSLDQRARTILKVAAEIVRQQDAFFARGIEHLRPLNLKAVAEAIAMHESTVSRVTSNKFMATPRGTFELKYFFTAAIQSVTGGEGHSAESVRHRIRAMIEEEDADTALSDDAIVMRLRASGIDIARRTVAKYREGLHIPSSVQRRREKLARPRQATS
jgi:RNA polymerase sigma-54 factor